ncbi:MAG: RecX family transcriptional regulator [Christensenellaceae bacterium]|nr:RecX family transcriptional regulator [Christensenellaceae bacterium]
MHIITSITQQQRRKTRYNIHTDNGFLISLSDESVVRHHLKVGGTISEELLAELREEDSLKYARELAFKYVAYAPRSEQQLLRHLSQKEIDPACASEACRIMKEYGYINDESFAKQYAESYLKKYSPYFVKQRLIAEGISASIAEAAVADADNSDQLKELFDKLYKKHEKEEPLKRKKKICDALARRGFSWSEVAPLFRDNDDD